MKSDATDQAAMPKLTLNPISSVMPGKSAMPAGCHVVSRGELRRLAAKPLSTVPRPFLRWAGSKRLVLSHFIDLLPDEFNAYFEPFFGSGALFFLVKPSKAVLGDRCTALIDTYRAVRDNPRLVARYLAPLRPSRKLFSEIKDAPSNGRFKSAAEFIYLNKVCWNGLYRVNAAGRFNVPYGMPKSENITDLDNLKICAGLLQQSGVTLVAGDFEDALKSASAGDLVYLDPPYVTAHVDNGFRDYNETLFSWEDQKRLARIAHDLADRGANVIVSNAYHQSIVQLYRGFAVHRYSRKSTLASIVSSRDTVVEAMFVLRQRNTHRR